MPDITIPAAALEAGARYLLGDGYNFLTPEAKLTAHEDARLCCLAMLSAWPGMDHGTMIFVAAEERYLPHIILPMTENSDDQ